MFVCGSVASNRQWTRTHNPRNKHNNNINNNNAKKRHRRGVQPDRQPVRAAPPSLAGDAQGLGAGAPGVGGGPAGGDGGGAQVWRQAGRLAAKVMMMEKRRERNTLNALFFAAECAAYVMGACVCSARRLYDFSWARFFGLSPRSQK